VSHNGTMRVGAIDIGSNSVRLLVADVSIEAGRAGTLSTVARAGEPCRLARGLDRTGLADPDMGARAAQVVSEFARRATSLGARHLVVGATAALRRASNGAEVAGSIGARAGVPVRILSGDDEARLVYRAVVTGLGSIAMGHPCVVFDLGGGSTEVVSGFGQNPGRWTSIPFGAVSLTERHLPTGPLDDGSVEALKAQVRDEVMRDCAYMPDRASLLAGVGGTVTVLASMDLGLESYDPTRIEGWSILRPRLDILIDRIVRATHAERSTWPVMGEGRADIVAAGALVVSVLAERFPAQGLVCSTQGLRYGLARLAAEELLSGAAGSGLA
jgi:exopolyphosphatase / guanosine-5'-triphosphate,3'-diphosphate pyrophosphatase